jgi:hypothetical protein
MPAHVDLVKTPCESADLALVWIDSRESSIVRGSDGHSTIERVRSDVPPHRRATGHHKDCPAAARADGESRRLEHLSQFVRHVSQHVPGHADVIVAGPGTVRWRLVRVLQEQDARHGVQRVIRCLPAPRWTRRQLLAEFRRATGGSLRRRTVGAYRWSLPHHGHGPSGLPVRVSPKHTRRSDDEEVSA